MRKNTDQKNSENRCFSRSTCFNERLEKHTGVIASGIYYFQIIPHNFAFQYSKKLFLILTAKYLVYLQSDIYITLMV